ncbi:hypothetical protein BKH46_08245 [Helicobacter sp. 12S02634-8]|uniref:tyrosine-type recombinase/integrase n=1 Tax=Helicobacter sp. 12S02634-8 TaxID=1476199 RepID=UPI000BA71801|nr:tyrosine-type recombinase/integrase [Helicobacter sp. 12S02634-8]PAF46222.1 hypothetical protein BKH46_08245 [Helicobacter sp. 12S02634-8]
MKVDSGNFIKDLEQWQKLFLDNLKIKNKSIHTLRSFKKMTDDFIEFCRSQDEIEKISDFNRIFLNLFLMETKESILKRKPRNAKNVSNWTINSYIATIRAFLGFISDNNEEMIDLIPLFRKIKRLSVQTEVPRFTPEENMRILSGLAREKKSKSLRKLRNALAFHILYYCGLRASELLGIKLKDITEASKREFYNIKVVGKGSKERIIPIKKEIIEDLLRVVARYCSPEDRVFNIAYETLYRNTNAFLKRCSIDKTKRGNHIFRHNLATLLVQKNTNMQIIQDILGHSNIATTARFYSRVAEKDKIDALEKLV